MSAVCQQNRTASDIMGRESDDRAVPLLFGVDSEPPARDRLVRHGLQPYHPEHRRVAIQQHLHALRTLAGLRQGASAGQEIDARQLHEIVGADLRLLLADRESALTLPFPSAAHLRRAGHCLEVSRLGMALAIEMDLSERNVCLIGLAGLLHDWGLRLRQVYGLPSEVSRLVQQVRRASARQMAASEGTHPFAPFLQVADQYAELKASRPGRPVRDPAAALRRLMRRSGRRSEPAVLRALLRVLSLFPLGSRVLLSDGSIGRVLRANADDFTRPIVQIVEDRIGQELGTDGELVDLLYSELRIVQTLAE